MFEWFINHEDPLKLCEEKEVTSNSEENKDDEFTDSGGEESWNSRGSETLERGSPGWGDEEEVTISVNESGRVTEQSDQVSDYTLRPDVLENLCLWDFVTKTEKVTQLGSKWWSEDDEDDRDMNYVNDDEKCKDENAEKTRDQGKDHLRTWHFLADHKEHGQRMLCMWKREVIPVPIGLAIPRRDQMEKYERYCQLMLILFKPWRKPGELRETSTKWAMAYQHFAQTMEMCHKEIVENMQVLHECRDCRNDHMQMRARQRGSQGGDGLYVSDMCPGDELEEVDMAKALEHLTEIDRMSSKKTEVLSREMEICIQELENAGWYAHTHERTTDDKSANEVGWNLEGTKALEDEWKSAL